MITALFILALIATVLDWLQTRYIANNPVNWHELNPILGQHPKLSSVNLYFASCMAIGAALTYFLPGDWKLIFLGMVSVVEGFMVARNKYLGINFFA